MTYELAEELRVAGFNKGNIAAEMMEGERETYYPTLSELIEACGDGFGALYKSNDKKLPWAASDQNVELNEWSDWDGLHINASTPEEAVARLWLALNKK